MPAIADKATERVCKKAVVHACNEDQHDDRLSFMPEQARNIHAADFQFMSGMMRTRPMIYIRSGSFLSTAATATIALPNIRRIAYHAPDHMPGSPTTFIIFKRLPLLVINA